VTAASVGGVPEILPPGSPAIVLEQRSAEAWSEGIERLVGARHAPSDVHAYAAAFGWDEVVTAQAALYRRVATLRE
jgi:hypothetical protein